MKITTPNGNLSAVQCHDYINIEISHANYFLRQYRLERELTSQLWKISSYDLSFRDWRSSQTSVGSFVSFVSKAHTHLTLTDNKTTMTPSTV